MRTILTIIWILALTIAVMADEATTTLDRCVVLNDGGNQTTDSKVALYFNIPNSVDSTEIMYAELSFEVTVQAPQGGALFELRAYPIQSDWTEQNIDYDAETDSVNVGAYTVDLANDDDFHIDITDFVRGIVDNERTNYGLMFDADILGDNYIRLPGNIGNVIKNVAEVRFIFK